MERVRIGIHVHAEPAELQGTLAAVRAHTPAFELLLLPDGPDAQTRELLATLHDIPQLATEEPRGAPACFNRLVAADADVYVLLESGSRQAPGWLERLL